MLICVQAVVEKKIFLVQFGYRHKKYMGSRLLVFISSKEKVWLDDPLSSSAESEQGEFLIIDRDPDIGEP